MLIPVTVAWVVAWAGAELAGRTRTPLLPALPAVLGFAFGLAFGGPGQLVGLTAALVAISAALGVWRALPEGASRGTRAAPADHPGRAAGGGADAGHPGGVGRSGPQRRPVRPAPPPSRHADLRAGHHPAQPDPGPAADPARPSTCSRSRWRPTPSTCCPTGGSRCSTTSTAPSGPRPRPSSPPAAPCPPPKPPTPRPASVVERVTVSRLSGIWLPVGGQAGHTSLDLVDVGTTSGSLAPGRRRAPRAVVPGAGHRVAVSGRDHGRRHRPRAGVTTSRCPTTPPPAWR